MPRNYYTYTDDKGNLFSFLQDETIAAAMGNGAAGAAQPRLARRHFFRPRHVTVKLGALYRSYVDGNQLFGGKQVGDATAVGTIVGWVDEKHASSAKFI